MSDTSRLSSPHALPDEQPDKALRPRSFAEFTGQSHIRTNLAIFVNAAKARSEALDHTLLHGPPGLGKTTLASIVAAELGVSIRTTSGPLLSKAGDLAAILTSLEARDVLFIDEIHRLNTAVEEILYPAMEDGRLDIIIGEGAAARTVQIELKPFTLVGATTRLGLLSNPLRDRFGIPLRLQFYSTQELQHVVLRAAQLLQMPMTEDGVLEVAKRARGTPRIAVRLLRRIRDIAQMASHATVTRAIADEALTMLEVDAIGLDSADRRYVSFIIEHYQGGAVGIDTIAAGLSEQRDTLEETIEPYLLQLGFLQRTPRGRIVTASAYAHLGLQPPVSITPPEQTDLSGEW